MFCIKCGAEIQAGTRFCIKCGHPVAGNPAAEAQAAEKPVIENPAAEIPAAEAPVVERPVTENPVTESPASENIAVENPASIEAAAMPKKSGAKKLLIIAAAAVIVVILAVVLLLNMLGSGFGSPEEATEKLANSYIDGDFNSALKAYPDFMIDYYGGADSIKEKLQEYYDENIASKFNDDFKMRYKATGHTLLNGTNEEKKAQEINDTYGADAEFEAIAAVKYQIVVIVEGKETVVSDTDENPIGYAVKQKGKWYSIMPLF